MQMNSRGGDFFTRATGQQVFIRAYFGFVLAALLSELQNQLFGFFLIGFRQAERNDYAEKGERAEENHHWEIIGKAQIDDFR